MSVPSQTLSMLGVPLTRLAGPILVLLILVMMVLPLPTLALDVLFTFNIAMAVIVLLASLNAIRPLDFSIFPTVLLLTTLLRLSLNVASARIILLYGQNGADAAGKVIESFGNFLVGGNYAVGLVVFVILILINFIVITRGAGRIAEVAARFTLDALPGKQLTIEADLNAGFINEPEARSRRGNLSRESDFYGAMDGASKFVRGDAIAGIIILIVVLLGGIAVGAIQHGLSLSEALDRYALLTVGDGLVAQIPALIISTSAGIMVSRTSSEQDLSRELLSQMFGSPQILYVAASVLALLGVIPGTPHVAFLLLASALAAAAYWTERRSAELNDYEAPAEEAEHEAPEELTWDDIPPVDVLGLEVGYRLIPLLDRDRGGQVLNRITESRRRFALEMGLVIPPVRVRDNLDLKPNTYRISLKGVEMGRAEAYPDHLLAIETPDTMGRLEGRASADPLTGAPGVWIPLEQEDDANMRSYQVLTTDQVISRHLEATFRTHAGELLGRVEVQELLDSMARATPGLVADVVPGLLPVTSLQALLQNLVNEGVSIRDSRTILECLAARASKTQNLEDLTETVRAALGRGIVDRLFEGSDTLQVVSLDAETENRLLQEMGEEGEALLSPDLLESLTKAAEHACAHQAQAGYVCALLVSPLLRPVLSRVLRRALPGLAVISYAEIPADKRVETTFELKAS
ncbi:MAG: flagellar biosynthesis protein FlhA [Thiobacillaceae bacterium]